MARLAQAEPGDIASWRGALQQPPAMVQFLKAVLNAMQPTALSYLLDST